MIQTVMQTRRSKLQREEQDFSIKAVLGGICKKFEVEEEDHVKVITVKVRALGVMSELKDLQKLENISEIRFDHKVFYPEDTICGGVEADVVAQIPFTHSRYRLQTPPQQLQHIRPLFSSWTIYFSKF